VSFVCRAGHASDEPDYCSVCGAPIVAFAAETALVKAASPPARSGGFCPLCGDAREPPDARYCEVCRFDFSEQKPGPPPIAAAARIEADSAPARGWELVITVDAALDTDPDPDHPCPTSAPPRVLAINRREMLVGRHDAQRDIHPEVPLFDPGASRRHAKLVHEADGGVALQDLASTNGSQINGKEVRPGMRRRLAEGDAVTLGRWTRITLRARR
jgi:hypothetical protein